MLSVLKLASWVDSTILAICPCPSLLLQLMWSWSYKIRLGDCHVDDVTPADRQRVDTCRRRPVEYLENVVSPGEQTLAVNIKQNWSVTTSVDSSHSHQCQHQNTWHQHELTLPHFQHILYTHHCSETQKTYSNLTLKNIKFHFSPNFRKVEHNYCWTQPY